MTNWDPGFTKGVLMGVQGDPVTLRNGLMLSSLHSFEFKTMTSYGNMTFNEGRDTSAATDYFIIN